MGHLSFRTVALASAFLAACGGGSTTDDAATHEGGTDLGAADGGTVSDLGPDGGGPDAVVVCHVDGDCDDGVFCNGVSRCTPGDAMADARGCVPMAGPPCVAGQTCDEGSRMCLSDCDLHGDADGDGHRAITCGGDDCDDADATAYPGNAETCDAAGHDEDCNPTTVGPDHDGDGFAATTCCNRQPGGALLCGGDCDDTTPDVSPSAPEVCDGLDDDCNGMVDEGVQLTFYRDVDGDAYGVTSMARMGCSAPIGYAVNGGDCDDARMAVHPGAMDVCNGIDDDCDGTTDPGCMCTMGTTQPCGTSDGAGGFLTIGTCHPGTEDCVTGTWGTCTGNVDPTMESCNGLDDNCDGTVDEGVMSTFYRDADGDSYGDTSTTVHACAAPTGYVVVSGDCDDTMSSVNPTALEACNGRDDNCNGAIDEMLTMTFYRDADGDGYGTPTSTVVACTAPAGYVAAGGDCDDGNAAVHPGAADGCDMVDNNCDGTVDPGCSCTDGAMQMCGTADGMGGFLTVGICHPGMQTCSAGAWGTCTGSVGPGPETCNGLDDDCNGSVDDGVTTAYYRDCDGDGYGARGSLPVAGCMPPATPPSCSGGTWVANSGDCNDGTTTIHPGLTEHCNRVDDDCDGIVDGAPASAQCLIDFPYPNTASETCSASGTCTVATCVSPFLDCSAGFGCETDPTWDHAHCGVCTTGCAFACVESSCVDTTQVDAGDSHSCARTPSGGLVCWGQNTHGGLGDGTTTSRLTPTTVLAIADATAVSAGGRHTCALRASGAVSCWGSNASGQLGNGSTTDSSSPVAVAAIADAVQIAAGQNHVCVRRTSGAVSCWGDNTYGQLGDGTTVDRHMPVAVSGLTDAVTIAAWNHHTCAVRATGGVVCWGGNANGQLGDGTTTQRTIPVAVSGITNAVEVGAGAFFSCARLATGAVSCWGTNAHGQLGDGTTTSSTVPVVTSGLTDAVELSLGDEHACARRTANTLVCWGRNDHGQLGIGAGTLDHTTPTAGSGITTAAQITCGSYHTCAYLASGGVKCWGANADGEVGDGSTVDQRNPVSI